MMKRLKTAGWIAFLSFISIPQARSADIYLQLQRGEKVMIALPEFSAKDGSEETKAVTQLIRGTAKDDILFTRLFNLMETGPSVGEGKIDFAGWGTGGADLLIKGDVSLKEDGVLFIASVFEIPSGNPVFQKIYKTPARNAGRAAHEFVADFIFRFTGNRGVSSTRIAFSNDATGDKELYIIDYDGKNLRRLTSDKSIAILPRWSPNTEEILFTTFRNGNPDMALLSLATGKSKIISRRRGLNTGAFSPDGKTIVATLSFEGASNLYLLDRDGKLLRRLGKSRFTETSASFSADGRKIVFVSDRTGMPQIYIMDADGSGVEKISDGGWCDAPVWSPAGDKIAYSKGDGKGHHDIVLYDISSGHSLQITSDSGKNENPSFSPDGRFVAFTSKRGKKRELYIASMNGSVEKKISDIPGSCFTPTWEP